MLLQLAFNQSPSGFFMVTVALPAASSANLRGEYTVTTFDDEDNFLSLLVEANLEYDVLADVGSAVLCAIHKPVFPQAWVQLEMTPDQCSVLGLDTRQAEGASGQGDRGCSGASRLQLGGGSSLEDFILQAPSPFAMLAGPQHLFTFINAPYVRLLGRLSPKELLGKSVRDALPEMEGQPFFRLLDEVYRTGKAYVGVEVRGNLRYDDGIYRDVYFDFIYHPVRDPAGKVVGLMAQATDVTDRVLSRQVSESREAQLYQQWAELDAIYRNSPVAMALVDADNFTIIRSNARHAALSGKTDEQILGKSIFEVYPGFTELVDIYRQVKSGLGVMDREMIGEVPSSPGIIRRWTANYSPIFSADGVKVVAIACASFELTLSRDDQVPEMKVSVGSKNVGPSGT